MDFCIIDQYIQKKEQQIEAYWIILVTDPVYKKII
jgi:hypothetical protein